MDRARRIRRITLSAIVATCTLQASVHATTFYVSSSEGDDTLNAGRSEQDPWRTIPHMIERMLDGVVQENDTVLFKRGDIFRKDKYCNAPWHARSWIILEKITLGAYGDPSQPRPVMSGGMPVTNWRVYHGNIYVADAPDTLAALYVNGEMMVFARYPNSGWLRRTDTENDDVFICEQLRQHPRNADDYWAGTTLRRRAHNWWWGNHAVTGYNASTGEIISERSPMETFGFFLDNKLEELDSAGEWYFDRQNMKVYLYAPGGVDPNTVQVEGTVYEGMGLQLKADGTRVEDLCFRYFHGGSGVSLAARVDVTRCLFERMGSDRGDVGLSGGVAGSSITHCMFRDMICVGIRWSGDTARTAPRTVFEFDTLVNIMAVPGYGKQGNQNWSNAGFVILEGANLTVKHCVFDHIGYAGIIAAGDYNTIEYNIFDDCMCILNDGSAIYLFCNHTTVRNNIVRNTRGCVWECGQGDYINLNITDGIWCESQYDFHDMVIENNTVAYTGAIGLRLTNEFRDTIRNNVVYGSGTAQVELMQVCTYSQTTRTFFEPAHLLIEGNVFVSTEPEQYAVEYQTKHDKADTTTEEQVLFQKQYDLDFGTIRNNYYCSPYTDTLFRRKGLHPKLYETRFTSANWSTDLSCADPSSKAAPIMRPEGAAPEDPTGTTRLVTNDQLARRTIPLDNGVYLTKDADTVYGAVTLDPYSSIVLWHTGRTATVPIRCRERIAEFVTFRGNGGRLSLHTRLSKRATVRIRVYALSGRLVGERTYRLQAGVHRLPMVDEHGAAACGFYHCEAAITTASARRQVRANVMVMW